MLASEDRSSDLRIRSSRPAVPLRPSWSRQVPFCRDSAQPRVAPSRATVASPTKHGPKMAPQRFAGEGLLQVAPRSGVVVGVERNGHFPVPAYHIGSKSALG
jgi:hypothetical protein